MSQQQQEYLADPMMIGPATFPQKPLARQKDFTIPVAISVLAICFCPVLGLAALVISLVGLCDRSNRNLDSLRNASLYVSLAAFLIGILFIAAILIIAFANKGSEIQEKPAGEEAGKIFWQSQA